MISFVLGSIVAGFFIGVGADMQSLLLNANANPYLAALAFSIGLCCVRSARVPLYTGKVGEVFEVERILKEFGRLLCMFVFNAIGAGLVSLLPWSCTWHKPLPLAEGWAVILPAMLCGGLVHLATRPERTYVATILCVIVFLLAGGQHCVANAYHVAKLGVTLDNTFFLLQCALGNALGAWLVWMIEDIEE